MIGLDTNVLVRLLTADEPMQLEAARQLLADHESQSNVFFVNDMVLVELVWVLKRLYGAGRDTALLAVTSLLENHAFAFEDRDRLSRAVELCKRKGHDFADAMIAVKNASMNCDYTATFDKTTRGLPSMRPI